MAMTLIPARPFPGAGVHEEFAQTATSHPPYATVVDASVR